MTRTVKVTLQIAPEVYAFARRRYAAGSYFSAKDYLNAVLNSAMLREMDSDDTTDPLMAKPPD